MTAFLDEIGVFYVQFLALRAIQPPKIEIVFITTGIFDDSSFGVSDGKGQGTRGTKRGVQIVYDKVFFLLMII